MRAFLTGLEQRYRAHVPSRGQFDPIASISDLLLAEDYSAAKGEIYQLDLLVKNLSDVRAVRSDVYAELRRKILRCKTRDNLVGLRTEARIASSLSRKGLDFDYSDAPDFRVRHGGSGLFLECTTTTLQGPVSPTKNLDYKIVAAMRAKDLKPYADGRLALTIDVGGLYAAQRTRSFDRDVIAERLAHEFTKLKLGSVLLFLTAFRPDLGRLEFGYGRFDCPGLDAGLAALLDQLYPFSPDQKRIFHPFYA